MIVARNLTRRYGSLVAVHGVSFEIAAGEVCGFLGENGAGKTTTMKMLTGYLSPTSGEASIGGLDVRSRSLECRRRVGYLPEHCALYLDMTVREHLLFAARVRRLDRARRLSALARVEEACGLRGSLQRVVGHLSKGFRQRVGLALALIHDPPILILDEPTTGLDPNQIVEIRGLIRRIGEERTVILSTHVLGEVDATCSRVLIIHRGALVADAPLEDLARSVARPPIRVAVKGAEDHTEALAALPGVTRASARPVDNDGRVFEVECEAETRNEVPERIFSWAVERQLVLRELHAPGASLEDVFRRLTRDGPPPEKPETGDAPSAGEDAPAEPEEVPAADGPPAEEEAS